MLLPAGISRSGELALYLAECVRHLDPKYARLRRYWVRHHPGDGIERRHQRIDLGCPRRLLRDDDGIAFWLYTGVADRPSVPSTSGSTGAERERPKRAQIGIVGLRPVNRQLAKTLQPLGFFQRPLWAENC